DPRHDRRKQTRSAEGCGCFATATVKISEAQVPPRFRVQPQTRTLHMTAAAKMDPAKPAMRKLWEDHITWTRNVIIRALAGLDDLDAVTQRLLQNPCDRDAPNTVVRQCLRPSGPRLEACIRDRQFS